MAKRVKLPHAPYLFSFDGEEVCVLIEVLRRIGGNMRTSPRKYTDSVLEALTIAYPQYPSLDSLIERVNRAIYFKDYPKKKGGR